MSDFPEGLYLGLTPDEEPAIFDAQDIAHVIFTDGGLGDPVRWSQNMIEATCDALGVEDYIGETGEAFDSIEKFFDAYYGDIAFNE